MSEGGSPRGDSGLEAARVALRAGFLVISDQRRQDRLRDEQTAPQLLRDLGLPEAIRPSLLELVERVQALRSRDQDAAGGEEEEASHETWRTPAGST